MIKTEWAVFMKIHTQTVMCVTGINGQGGHEFERDWRKGYGWVWREEKEGVIMQLHYILKR